jgi:hypothetical protein
MQIEFWSGNLKGGNNLEDVGVNTRIILKWILRGLDYENVVWIHLAQDTAQWRALVNTVMNFHVP